MKNEKSFKEQFEDDLKKLGVDIPVTEVKGDGENQREITINISSDEKAEEENRTVQD